jgi:hypothetical protein
MDDSGTFGVVFPLEGIGLEHEIFSNSLLMERCSSTVLMAVGLNDMAH